MQLKFCINGSDKKEMCPKESSILFCKILKREVEKMCQIRNNMNIRKKYNDLEER